VQTEIDISKYTSHFHDGDLLNIVKLENEVALRMSSAEVDCSEVEKGLTLSENHRIRGILHLCNIQSIHLTGEYELENLFDVFNFGTILDFEMTEKTVELGVLWENRPPKPHTNEFTTITIQADYIWWENIPDLYDPFW
jgi:hypothetical protein